MDVNEQIRFCEMAAKRATLKYPKYIYLEFLGPAWEGCHRAISKLDNDMSEHHKLSYIWKFTYLAIIDFVRSDDLRAPPNGKRIHKNCMYKLPQESNQYQDECDLWQEIDDLYPFLTDIEFEAVEELATGKSCEEVARYIGYKIERFWRMTGRIKKKIRNRFEYLRLKG